MDRSVELIRAIFSNAKELEDLHGRRFTPDGHMVGSIGEVWAASLYDVTLLPMSTPIHDATAPDGRLVQIKATQRSSVALYDEPEHLIVLKLRTDGTAEEAFNGPGAPVWAAAGKMGKNSQRQISLAKLRNLMNDVPEPSRLARRLAATATDESPSPNE